jgi:hypothetical protein
VPAPPPRSRRRPCSGRQRRQPRTVRE